MRRSWAAGNYTELPFTTYHDMVVDTGHDQVFVTAGHHSGLIAAVKLDVSGVTMISTRRGRGACR